MEGLKLLKYWKVYIDLSIRQVWQSFHADRRLLLTESDLKCNLYKFLTNQVIDFPYQVHSEVTHHHHQEDRERRRWAFRDISLLNPNRLHLNDEVENLYEQLSKGFYHQGEAVFMELKFQKLPIAERQPQIVVNHAIEHLKTYIHTPETPKLAYLIWGSQNNLNLEEGGPHDLVQRMINNLTEFSEYECEHIKIPEEQVFGFVFKPYELYEVRWNEDRWIANPLLNL